MTNFEKYKDDLMKIEGSFAVDKNSKKIAGCVTTDGVKSCIDCHDCIFDAGDCLESDKIHWLCKEYEGPILSNDELELVKALGKVTGKEYKYVARDAYGNVIFFTIKPHANKFENYYSEYGFTYIDLGLENEVLFSNITHEDGLYDIKNECFIKEEGDN